MLHIASFNMPQSGCCHHIFSAFNVAEGCILRASSLAVGVCLAHENKPDVPRSYCCRSNSRLIADGNLGNKSSSLLTMCLGITLRYILHLFREFLRRTEFHLPMVGVDLIAHRLLAAFSFCLDTLVFPVVIFQIEYLLSNPCLSFWGIQAKTSPKIPME